MDVMRPKGLRALMMAESSTKKGRLLTVILSALLRKGNALRRVPSTSRPLFMDMCEWLLGSDKKEWLIALTNLALFDPSRTTIVSADASSFGIGGVLRQEQPDGSLKPIAYVSRTLSETEKRYSQIEKEGLAIVWTCDRLKDYVTGIKIHIETDHKPLIAIFTSKSLEDMTPRLQRLKMRMMRYSYQISHIAGKKQIVADMLSRKPMSKPHKDELEEELSAYIQSIEFPATEERLLEISRKQKEDSLCSQLAKYCMSGWPKNKREVDPELRGYWQFQEDLTYQNGLLLRGQRILIPKTLRKDILEKLHQGHFGINKCRSRAKESVWWLGISQEIERMVSSCTKCLKERKPKHEPLMPSEFPIRPWQKVGMDLFYLNGRWYLIVCDYYSRYPEISFLQNLTAQEVIGRLKSIFARHGTPETVKSDNGPQFQKVLGSEFSKFSKEWSFKHITSSPKFPQSNGFIEAIIKNIKQSFKKEEDCYLTLQAYRTMPLESGYSPAELLMGRRLRTSVPAIESSLMPRYLDSEALQEREKRRVINQKRLYDKRHDVHSLPPLQQGDSVWVRDQRVKGKVLHKSEEPRSYWVQTPQGKVRRNRLHLTPLPKMGSTMDASEDDQEQETEEDCPTPTASSTRDGRMQRDNQDQDPEKSLPSMPAVHTRYGRAVKIPRRTTIVSADASSFGIGGVLRQEQPDGSLKPIAYVSRTLSETEKRYSQIEKEGLAIVWTCDRLKDYVTGIKIHIETDHKPLIAIFTSKSLEDMTPRLQRLKMRMMRYSYQISHIAGKKQIVADMLSRKPMSKPHKDELEEELSAYIQSIEFPATEERLLEISRKQKEDSLCSQLAKYCMSGWPKNKREVDPELRGYWQFQEDLTYQNGLLLRGQRILIPKTLRKDILEKLHQGHFGINKCRSRAKESVWWLGISQEIERMVSSCTKCLKERKPKHEPLMPSEFPIRPWQKVGMDLFYLNGRWYLIVCDYYSRYPEISFLQNLTAQEVIGRLKSIFARHGTPETVKSDNGPQFQKVLGSEFSKFSKEWSFKHITSSPKFPQSNGFIEAIIKNIKQSFKKEEDCYLTLQAYRTMPLESGYSPAELLMGRRLRTSVPAIESSLMPRYLDSEALQEREKRRVINQKRLYDKRHDVHSLPPLQQGDSVWVRDQRVKGKVLHKSEEPRSYWVQTPQGKVRRNRLHLTPLPKMGSTMDASEDDQEQETEEDCPTPTASSTRDGRMQRDNQDQNPEKSLPSMPAVHTRYGRAVKIPRRFL
ncbi:K02A2.6-like [Cordylochernes scorpioides]|uniref:RNA-directed DNA polymerase n=1 Tax=Cordylochernes scorpioides TaxID=51811 RepID=A0ABY6LNS8_9ARAC|nr:K02A2.6-like [Cordylochernes scorpioides]